MSKDFWRGFGLGIFLVGVMMFVTADAATLDAKHPAHEKAEAFVCNHPRHALRGHGLSIMPEACDGR